MKTMNLSRHPPSNRVPGEIKRTREYSLNKDLTKLSQRELLDLKHRQMKLLENKSFVQKLPDKGLKIKDLYDRAVKALEVKSEIDEAANLLSSLKLGANDINNIEWKDSSKSSQQQDVLDSDDDEDPLAILTSSNTVNKNRIIVKQEDETQESLITEQDIKEAHEIVNGPLHLDPVLEHVVQNENFELSKRFLPHKAKSNSLHSSSSSLNDLEKVKKVRDNTAASPPELLQGVKMLSLRDSIEIEHAHQQKMKELQEKQAVERLAVKTKELGVNFPVNKSSKPDSNFMSKYRLATSVIGEEDGDDFNDSLSDEDAFDED